MNPNRPVNEDDAPEATFAAFGSAPLPRAAVHDDRQLASTGRDASPRDDREAKTTARSGGPVDNLEPDLIEPGSVLFGKYRVVRELGGGGMGSVWLVEHLTLQRPAALKFIRSEIAGDELSRRRFEQEAVILAKLGKHRNAVEVYDAGFEGRYAYIAMEYLSGQTLKERLEPGEPTPPGAVGWALEQLCAVLGVAHGLGIVHRDIKPANIMLVADEPDGDERVRLLDFGIAKIVHEHAADASMTQHTAGYLGTLPYSSPEQLGIDITGDRHPGVDHRSDIYSLGVLLYEMLCGVRPFLGSQTQLVHAHASLAPPSFAKAPTRVDVPKAVEALVLRCLEKDRAKRPQSVDELLSEFKAAIGEPIEPPKPPRLKPRKPFPKRAVAVAAALVCIVGLGIVAAVWQRITDRPEDTPEVLGTAEELPPAVRRWLAEHRLERADKQLRDGWPIAVKGTDGSPSLLALHGRHYLPAGYEPDTPSGENAVGLPKVLASHDDGTRFILVEGTDGASFVMGAFGKPDDFDDEEKPGHKVDLSPFYLQETEVTIRQFERFCKQQQLKDDDPAVAGFYAARRGLDHDPAIPKEDLPDFPATGVSHGMAARYSAACGGALPTEAQWEYSARSGGRDRLFVWGDSTAGLVFPGKKANVSNPGGQLSDVRAWPEDRTEQGIRGLTGNAREWCRDVHAPYKRVVTGRDPWVRPEPTAGEPAYVIRGGSYETPDCTARVTWRGDLENGPAYRARDHQAFPDVGFRVALDIVSCDLNVAPVAAWSAKAEGPR